jgi:DeoR family fructose operon transcriptional repressor
MYYDERGGVALMLIAERQDKIVRMVEKLGSVQVEELAKELDVSTMTIRRDLEKLNAQGIINRCHGGAVSKNEVIYADKRIRNSEIKSQLAKACYKYVKESNVVFLDAGTTTYEIAKLISNIPEITVVTNDIEIAKLLLDSSADLIICGGQVQKSTGSIHGYYTTQMIEFLRFDIAFFGTAAIDEDLNVMTPTTDKAFLKRMAIQKSQNAVLVADHSKFHSTALTFVNRITDYDNIVTDFIFPKDTLKEVNKTGTMVTQI